MIKQATSSPTLSFHGQNVIVREELIRRIADRCPDASSVRFISCHEARITKPCFSAFAKLKHFSVENCSQFDDEAMLLFASCCCDELKTLTVSGCTKLSAQAFIGVSFAAMELETLSISLCVGFNAMAMVQCIAMCPQLRQLRIDCCIALSDHQLAHAAKEVSFRGSELSQLTLRRCKHVHGPGLAALLQHMPQLRSVDIGSCANAGNSVVSAIARFCKHIQRLNVEWTQVNAKGLGTALPRMSNLHQLNVNGCAGVSDMLLRTCSLHCRKLSCIEARWCKRITATGIAYVLRECDIKLIVISPSPKLPSADALQEQLEAQDISINHCSLLVM